MEQLVMARPSDWDTYRDILRELYIDRNMSLPRVMEHMSQEYSFRASKSMYKSRFAKWGFEKNMNSDRAMTELLEQVNTGGSSPAVHDHPLNVKTKFYLERLTDERRRQFLRHILEPLAVTAPNSSTPSPRLLTPPGELLVQQQYIHLMQCYVKGSSEGHLWPSDPVTGFKNEDVVPAWCSPLMSAAWVLDEGKEDEAKRLLGLFVKQCSEQLVRQDPLLFAFIYTSVLFFAKTRPGIATYLLKVFYDISETLPWADSSHPLRHLLRLLYRLQPQGIVAHASNILLGYINIIHETLGEAYPIVQDMLSDTMMRMLSFGLCSPERVADLGNRMALVAKLQDRHRNRFYFNLQLYISKSYMKMGNYRAARETATDIMSSHNDGIRDERIAVMVHMLLCEINEAEGQQDEAIKSALRAIVASIEHFGEWSDWCVNALIFYRRVLERAGRVEEAQRVMQDRDLAIRKLCEKGRNLT
ncbi:Clr5 domain-containing protein [Rostrohypoxylon terebratum]|nr:Clr5 domain-containing protein [Rostrohypoxylon terebratum]